MNNQQKDLGRYFEAFNDTNRMSEQQAWEILDRATMPEPAAPPVESPEKKERRNRGMWYFIFGLVAIVGGGLLVGMPKEEARSATASGSRPPVGSGAQRRPEEKARQDPAESKLPSSSTDVASGNVPMPTSGRKSYGAYRDHVADLPKGKPPVTTSPSTIPLLAPGDSVTVDTIFMKKTDSTGTPPTPIIRGPIEMTGIRLLDFTREEMIGFGMAPVEGGVGMFVRRKKGGTSFATFTKSGSSFKVDSAFAASWPARPLAKGATLQGRRNGEVRMSNVDGDEFAPEEHDIIRHVGPKEERDRAYASYRKKMNAYMMKLAPTLIPVLVRTGSGPDHRDEDDQVLWFIPTPELLANLPAGIRDRVIKEVESAGAVSRGTITHQQALQSGMVPTLDLVHASSGMIKGTVLTNDTTEFTLQVSLSEPRSVRVELFDIEGRRLDQLRPSEELPFGDHTLRFSVEGKRHGIYLVVVSTDKQERAIHRVWLSQQ